MRVNRYIALATGISRRTADAAVQSNRVQINGKTALPGDQVSEEDKVLLDGRPLSVPTEVAIMLNKPVGYVVSRDGQGNKTVYELLPPEYNLLKPVGRLDKNSSGLLLLTNSGKLVFELTHPSFAHDKLYEVKLNKSLRPNDEHRISNVGVMLEDGNSKLQLKEHGKLDKTEWQITMHEGRNRQIRRTFKELGYKIVKLHRISHGSYVLGDLKTGQYKVV
jgi:23S rRNA pseudouridine2605 synthase